MKKILILLLLMIGAFTMTAQVRPHIQEIVNRISEYSSIDAKFVGISGSKSDLYLDFEKLQEEATIKELTTLIGDTNLVVKGYAALALTDRNYVGMSLIFETFLNLKGEIDYHDGCSYYPETLANLLYSRAFFRKFVYVSKIVQYSISNETLIKQLDSVYLYSKNRLDDLSFTNQHVFENFNIDEPNYAQIRKIALQENNLYALLALSKYKK